MRPPMKVIRDTDGDVAAEHDAYRAAVRALAYWVIENAQSSPEISRFFQIEDFQQVFVSDLLLELLRAIRRLDLPTKHHDA
jgi:hypothetical protein